MNNLAISTFSEKTLEEWKAAGEKKLLSNLNYSKTLPSGSMVVLANFTDSTFVGIARTTGEFHERSLLDADIYTGIDSKYNKWEIELSSVRLFNEPIRFAEVARWCGIPEDDKVQTNICKGSRFKFARAFYKNPAKEDEILEKFRRLVSILA
jgi:hypothetical protein